MDGDSAEGIQDAAWHRRDLSACGDRAMFAAACANAEILLGPLCFDFEVDRQTLVSALRPALRIAAATGRSNVALVVVYPIRSSMRVGVDGMITGGSVFSAGREHGVGSVVCGCFGVARDPDARFSSGLMMRDVISTCCRSSLLVHRGTGPAGFFPVMCADVRALDRVGHGRRIAGVGGCVLRNTVRNAVSTVTSRACARAGNPRSSTRSRSCRSPMFGNDYRMATRAPVFPDGADDGDPLFVALRSSCPCS